MMLLGNPQAIAVVYNVVYHDIEQHAVCSYKATADSTKQ